jgi:hypothetical protein
MRFFLLTILFFAAATVSLAYNPIIAEPPEPYVVIPIEGDPYVQKEYLGTLADFPDMYELTSEVAFTLQVKVRQRASAEAPFGLIVVRQNDDDGGVTEVVRLSEPLTAWKEVSDSTLGIKFLEGTTLSREVTPGTYRIEVSSPDNKGEYMLLVGDEPARTGFFSTLADVYTIQRHFGYTPLHMLFSNYVYYIVGILLVSYGFYRTWRYQHNTRYGRIT